MILPQIIKKKKGFSFEEGKLFHISFFCCNVIITSFPLRIQFPHRCNEFKIRHILKFFSLAFPKHLFNLHIQISENLLVAASGRLHLERSNLSVVFRTSSALKSRATKTNKQTNKQCRVSTGRIHIPTRTDCHVNQWCSR